MATLIGIVRLCARVIATPVFVVSFGFFWLGFVLFLGPMFQLFSFLENEKFDWREHIKDCNEFFREPLAGMWKAAPKTR